MFDFLRIIHEDVKTTFSEVFYLYCECLHRPVVGDIEVKAAYPGGREMCL